MRADSIGSVGPVPPARAPGTGGPVAAKRRRGAREEGLVREALWWAFFWPFAGLFLVAGVWAARNLSTLLLRASSAAGLLPEEAGSRAAGLVGDGLGWIEMGWFGSLLPFGLVLWPVSGFVTARIVRRMGRKKARVAAAASLVLTLLLQIGLFSLNLWLIPHGGPTATLEVPAGSPFSR